jgi:outer membrane biogenesis lipoprotein LolB
VTKSLILALAATLLAGCTISTELDPEGFQSWRKKDRAITGSNLPRREGDEATVKGMEADDLAKMQRSSGTTRTN